MLNGEFLQERAAAMAERLRSDAPSDTSGSSRQRRSSPSVG
jgi:hypothetical protein